MIHYDFHRSLRPLYEKAVKQYQNGQRGAASFFSPNETKFLASIGMKPQEMYDFAEDAQNYGEPDWETALAITAIRRDYFLNVQNGAPSTAVLDEASLPAKTEAVDGIEWLPRILPKAKAKLRGELPDSLMYCCGGDRKFFKKLDIHPVEFLSLVWRNMDNDKAIVAWVKQRNGGFTA